MSRRLDETDLNNLERAARTGFSHPADVLRLVEEVRELRKAGDSLEKTIPISERTPLFPAVDGYRQEARFNEDGSVVVTYTELPRNVVPPTGYRGNPDPRRFDVSVKKLYEACGLLVPPPEPNPEPPDVSPAPSRRSGIVVWTRGKRYFFPLTQTEWFHAADPNLNVQGIPNCVYHGARELFDRDGVLWNYFESATEETVGEWLKGELEEATQGMRDLVLLPEALVSFPKSDPDPEPLIREGN